MQLANQLKQNPESIAEEWAKTKPGFKEFYDENKNLSLPELARKYNIPF